MIYFLHELHQLIKIKNFTKQSIRVIINEIKFVLIREIGVLKNRIDFVDDTFS